MDDSAEFTLFNKRQSKAYQIVPAVSAAGHNAQEWKESIWIGRCRVVGKGTTLSIRLQDASTDDLFAECSIPNGDHEKYVERCVDSSRYFVLKITNGPQHAFIGFGFSDRNDAFDFVAALDDFRKRYIEPGTDLNSAPKIAGLAQDMSLKEGQAIKVNLKGIGIDSQQAAVARQPAAVSSAPIPLLAPPPAIERSTAPPRTAPQSDAKDSVVAPRPATDFKPAPPRDRDREPHGAGYQADNSYPQAAFAMSESTADNFADFQSAPGHISVSREKAQSAGAASTGHKSLLEYFLPMSLLGQCTVNTTTPDEIF